MFNQIKILLMILAYGLNFAHDVQIHDHHSASDPSCMSQQSMEHFHDTKSICKHTDNESKELPFVHCHVEHAQPYPRYVNTQTSVSSIDNSILIEEDNVSHKIESPRIIPIRYNHFCFYQDVISTSQGLRAPPALS